MADKTDKVYCKDCECNNNCYARKRLGTKCKIRKIKSVGVNK